MELLICSVCITKLNQYYKILANKFNSNEKSYSFAKCRHV